MTHVHGCPEPFKHYFGIEASFQIEVLQLHPEKKAIIHVYSRINLGFQNQVESYYLDMLEQDDRAKHWQLRIELHRIEDAPEEEATFGELAEESAILNRMKPASPLDYALADLHAAVR